jgi:hypothetical protein
LLSLSFLYGSSVIRSNLLLLPVLVSSRAAFVAFLFVVLVVPSFLSSPNQHTNNSIMVVDVVCASGCGAKIISTDKGGRTKYVAGARLPCIVAERARLLTGKWEVTNMYVSLQRRLRWVVKYYIVDPPENWHSLCVEARKNNKGASLAIFLGRNANSQTSRRHPYMILTENDATSSSSSASLDDVRLHLPKAPTAIFATRATRQQDLYDQADARGLGMKFNICPQIKPQDFEKLLTVDVTIWKSLLLDDCDLDATLRRDSLQFIDQLLKYYQWSSNVTIPLQDGIDLSWILGKKIVLGGGIDMVYLTPPGICFADLQDSEKAWFGVRQYHIKPPVVRLPVVIYQSVEEGWYSLRINIVEVISAVTKTSAVSETYNNDIDNIWLKIFILPVLRLETLLYYSRNNLTMPQELHWQTSRNSFL